MSTIFEPKHHLAPPIFFADFVLAMDALYAGLD